MGHTSGDEGGGRRSPPSMHGGGHTSRGAVSEDLNLSSDALMDEADRMDSSSMQHEADDACMESLDAKEKCSVRFQNGYVEGDVYIDSIHTVVGSSAIVHDGAVADLHADIDNLNSSNGIRSSSLNREGMDLPLPVVNACMESIDIVEKSSVILQNGPAAAVACKASFDSDVRNSGMISEEHAVVDARMDCEEVLHAPIHRANYELPKADVAGTVSDMFVEPAIAVGESVFNFHNKSQATSNTKCFDNSTDVGISCSVPQLGKFCFGTGLAPSSMNPVCNPSIRHLVSSKPVDRFSSGESSRIADKPDCPSKFVWNRPVIISLPQREEFGNGSVCDGRGQLDVDDVLHTVKRFDMALIGRLFGRRFSFDFLYTELHRRWSGFGNFKLVTINGDCFVCFFESVASRDAVIMGGPWIVAGQVIGVDFWSPTFSSTSSAGFITPVWVRFPNLPMYCWGGMNIARIAGLLGEPIGIDAATDRLERGHFARVCIRIDLAKPLIPGMWIDGPYGSFFQNVEYEGLSTFCFQCGHVGHKAERCSSTSIAKKNLPQNVSSGEHVAVKKVLEKDSLNSAVEEECLNSVGFGPWMLVSRKKKIQNNRGVDMHQIKRPVVNSMGYQKFRNMDVGFSKHLSSAGTAAIRSHRSNSFHHNNVVHTDVDNSQLNSSLLAKQNDKLKVHYSNAENENVVKAKVDSEISSVDFGHTHHGVAWTDDMHNGDTYNGDDMHSIMQVHNESCREVVQPNSSNFSTLPRGSKKDKMVKELGPITSGSRFKKRKQTIPNNVGGDASSRKPP